MLLTCRRALLCAVAGLAALGVASPSFAADPAKVVNDVAAQVLELIKTRTGAERQAGFTAILETSFDLPAMGQSALGTYWARATPEQRTRFLKATATAESKAYAERFGQYGGQTIAVGRVANRPNGLFWVDSQITQTNSPPIKVEWELQDRGGGMRITDVKVEGVSMVMTRRSDFSSYISRNGGDLETLITELESRAR